MQRIKENQLEHRKKRKDLIFIKIRTESVTAIDA